jgi:hypothetical protein
MRYLGRRQSRKVRDVLAGSTTPDEVARTIGPMWAETLAGWAAAVIADMASAGWDMAYLASVGRFLWVRSTGSAVPSGRYTHDRCVFATGLPAPA